MEARNIKSFFSSYTNLIIFLLLVTTFSGMLRKWAGLSSFINNLSLLILMVVPIYLLFIFKNNHTLQLNKTVKSLLGIFCFLLVILALNPLNHTYFHGLLGFLMHFVFIGIVISYIKNKKTFNEKKIIKLFFIILVVQLIIASIQYNSSAESAINRYADNRQEQQVIDEIEDNDHVQATALVGNSVRVSGTFSYLGGYTAVVFFLLFFCFYLVKTKGYNYLLFLSPIIFYMALLSGSRGCVGFVLILLIVFIVTERKLFIKTPKAMINGLVIILLIFLINLISNDTLGIIEKTNVAYDNFIERVETSREEGEGRLTSDLLEVFNRDFAYRYTGIGLGSTYQGAIALFGASEIVYNTPMEGELFRLIIEGGIFLVLFRWLFLIVIFRLLDIPLIMKVTTFLFFCVFSQNVFHIYNAIYFAIGLIVLNQAYIKDLSREKLPV